MDTAAALGISRSTYANYETGANEPKTAVLIRMLQHFNTSFESLMGTENKEQAQQIQTKFSTADGNFRSQQFYRDRGLAGDLDLTIPILDVSAAAGPGFFNSDYLNIEERIRFPPSMMPSAQAIAIHNWGASMEPTVPNGSLLIIQWLDPNQWESLKNNRIYVITDKEGSTWVKRIQIDRQQSEILNLVSDNPDKSAHPIFKLSKRAVFRIWSVEWVIAKPGEG